MRGGAGAKVSAPAWFAKGKGRVVQSTAGAIDLRLCCRGDGELRIVLRGMDVRDARGNRVPFWIDYTSLLVNGEEQLRGVACVWHDKPYRLALPARDGEELDVRVRWRPHDESARNLGLEAQQAAEAKLAAARKETQRALDDLAAVQDEAREAKAQLAERAVELAKTKEDIEGLELAVAEARRARDAEATRADGLAAEVEGLKALVAETQRARDAQATRADGFAADLARLRGSASWKAGRVVTWPARKLKRLVKRLVKR